MSDPFTLTRPTRVPLTVVLNHYRRCRRGGLNSKQWLFLLVLAEAPERCFSWREVDASLELVGTCNTGHQKRLAGRLIQAGLVIARERPNQRGARPSTVYQITGKGRVFLGLDQEGNFR